MKLQYTKNLIFVELAKRVARSLISFARGEALSPFAQHAPRDVVSKAKGFWSAEITRSVIGTLKS